MGRTVGIISLLIVFAFAILLIMGIWGYSPLSLANLGRLGLTMFILLLFAAFAFAIWAMFFWKGNNRVLPTSSKEKEAMRNERKSDY